MGEKKKREIFWVLGEVKYESIDNDSAFLGEWMSMSESLI